MTINLPYKLTLFRHWRPDMGNVPYCWSDYPAGARCGWTCAWSTSQGLVTPFDWCFPRNMSEEELLAELKDVAAFDHWSQERDAKRAKELLVKPFEFYAVTEFLTDARQRYKEFVAMYCPPAEIKVMYLRMGWPRSWEEVAIQAELDLPPARHITAEEGR